MAHPVRREGEFSLFNVLKDQLLDAARNIPDNYWTMTEHELRQKAKPTPTDYALRVSFWKEFELAMRSGKANVTSYSVHKGICSTQYWYKKFLCNQPKLAWILRPMQGYEKELEAILHRATERLWEIVDLPIYDDKGRADPKAAAVVLSALKEVTDRVHGMAVQRQQKLQVNVNQPATSRIAADLQSMENVDERIKELEAKVSGRASGQHHAIGQGSEHEEVLEAELCDAAEDGGDALDTLQKDLAEGGF